MNENSTSSTDKNVVNNTSHDNKTRNQSGWKQFHLKKIKFKGE